MVENNQVPKGVGHNSPWTAKLNRGGGLMWIFPWENLTSKWEGKEPYKSKFRIQLLSRLLCENQGYKNHETQNPWGGPEVLAN